MSVSATRLNKMLNSRRFFSSSTAAKLSRPLAPATNFQQSYNSNYKNHSNGSNSNTSSDSNFSNADMGSMAAAISATSLATAGLFYVLNGSSPAQSGPNLSDPKAKPMIKELTKNTAFVFIKPHANTVEARRAVKEGLLASGNNGMKVLEEGLISGERIEKEALIDNHYYSIASKATLLPPSKLNVPENKFKEKFGCEWKDMLSQNKVFNAKEACKVLGLTSEELNTEWAKSKKANKLVKFGGGFYCGLVDSIPGKQPIYVMNGFFMSMRQNYVAPGSSIYYYVVEWDSDKLSWEDFRGKLLGPTDPATAPEGSLRGHYAWTLRTKCDLPKPQTWAHHGLDGQGGEHQVDPLDPVLGDPLEVDELQRLVDVGAQLLLHLSDLV